jgi:hypothetical protein
LNKRTRDVIQRIATAERIAGDDFQSWLVHKNRHGYEVYLSMNALAKATTGRTKADVEVIRHIYLDFDTDGTAAVERVLARNDLPQPNYLINTSADKWQVVWKVHEFDKDQAETLQRWLAQELGADPAATDCARVLRLPGFHNRKYKDPFLVAYQKHSREVYGPERFPEVPSDGRSSREILNKRGPTKAGRDRPQGVTQSERDWAFAKRSLARGEPPELVIAQIENYRRFEKHDPHYYAELTVKKAAQSLGESPADFTVRAAEHDR